MITPPTVATAVPLPSCTPGNAATRPAAVLWDRLAGAHAIASHDWLTAIERASIPGLTPHYPSLPDGAGAAVCYEARDRRCGLDPTGLLLGRLRAPAEVQEFIPGGPEAMRTVVVLFDRRYRL